MATPSGKRRQALLDAESGTITKRWRDRLRIALVYPNVYHVGMSNLGFATVYRLFNACDNVVCERAFLPDPGDPGPPVSLESGRSLRDFDVVAFSIAFENDFPHVLAILQKAGLPLTTAQRSVNLPLTLAGGVTCFLNPEPLSPFIDAFVLGEAESVAARLCAAITPGRDRDELLLDLARNVEGVYVPRFYRPDYRSDGTLAGVRRLADVPDVIRRTPLADVRSHATDSVVTTTQTTFDDTYLIEVSRGCPHGCRFCSAGFIYRPPRFRPLDQLRAAVKKGAAAGRKIGLVGAAVSDLPHLSDLCTLGRSLDLQIGFSSLRADALTNELIATLRAGRVKTATIAPETGSARMRQVINKGLDEATILRAAEQLVAGGIPNLKLYFMVGLPTETEEDVKAIVALVKKIKHCFLSSSRTRGRIGTITVSLNCFVPKPFTPFQWAAMDEPAVLKKKIKTVKNGLKAVANVQVHADMPRWAQIQGLLARGDRRAGDLLALAHANNGNWPQTFKASPVNPAFFLYRSREKDERLPWDFIDHGLNKDFLWKEYRRAMAAKPSPPCPEDTEKCRRCGVCAPVDGAAPRLRNHDR